MARKWFEAGLPAIPSVVFFVQSDVVCIAEGVEGGCDTSSWCASHAYAACQ